MTQIFGGVRAKSPSRQVAKGTALDPTLALPVESHAFNRKGEGDCRSEICVRLRESAEKSGTEGFSCLVAIHLQEGNSCRFAGHQLGLGDRRRTGGRVVERARLESVFTER